MCPSELKWKLATADICRQYFELIFPGVVNGELNNASYSLMAKALAISAADASFKEDIFVKGFEEEVALNVELFGLAWLHFNYNPRQERHAAESLGPEEIVFTKRYLHNNEWPGIWERMAFYNEAISNKTLGTEPWEIATEQRLRTSFGEYTDDPECISRLISRYSVFHLLSDPGGIAGFSQDLTLKLEERLGCHLDCKGLFALQSVVVGLWADAVYYLEQVRDFGSLSAAQRATDNVMRNIKKVLNRQREREKK